MKRHTIPLIVLLCGITAFLNGCAEKDSVAVGSDAAVTPQPSIPAAQPVTLDVPDTALVTVNGKQLKRSDAAELTRQLAARQGVPPQMLDAYMAQAGAQLEKQTIEHFISQTILDAEVERRQIEVTDEDIAAVIADISKQIPEGMTVEEAIAAQGVTMAQLRTDIVLNEGRRKVYEAETANADPVTDEQVNTFYEENAERFTKKESVDARHILVACDGTADEAAHAEAKAKAESIGKELAEGGDFAELAKTHSSCPSNKDGGSLGTFGRGQMVPPFEEAAFSQEIGVNGPVIKTQFGYHIVQVTAREEAGQRPLADVSDDIRERLAMMAKQETFETFLNGLRDSAEIDYATE